MKRFTFLFVLMLTGAILMGCGGSGAGGTRTVNLDMTEYAYKPAELNLKVGETVTIALTNSGKLEHEVMFGRGLKTNNGRPNGYETDMFQAGGVTPKIVSQVAAPMNMDSHEHGSGVMVVVPPGDKGATITFPVTEGMVGEWEMGCFKLDGVHYDSGMKGKVTVSK